MTSQDTTAAVLRAEVLTEAVKYVERFTGQLVVVKIGGATLTDPVTADELLSDIAMIHSLGMKPVVVHGGGPQITEWTERLGLEAVFSNGHRVTDAATLELVRMVLVGKINRDIVAGIGRHGAVALGLSGEDGGLLRVVPRHPDLGYVGDVTEVNSSLIQRLLDEDLVPVIATIGVDGSGQPHNVNADLGGAAVAVALGAQKLIYMTDVDGLLGDAGDPSSLISEIGIPGLKSLLEMVAVTEGMIPKVEGCMAAIAGGVRSAHILNGGMRHALLVELLSDKGVGTMVLREATT